MSLILVYRTDSENAREAEEFLRDYHDETGRDIEVRSPDDASGQQFIELYDIVSYPTLIALGPDGTVLAKWRDNLPTIDEVSIY